MSASPFQGCWSLYGMTNAEAMFDKLALPNQFKCAMKNVRVCEDIHVNGDNVHIGIRVPNYHVAAHSKDINFTFGVESDQSLPFGKCGKATTNKEGENKWHAKVAVSDGGQAHITREIRNGEMWVTIEAKGVKAIRKFERCIDTCPMTGAKIECQKDKECSPFQGKWRLYGSDNFEKFMEAIGVPAHWRCIFSNIHICETIHVNGNDVHIRICLPDIAVPAHSHEVDFTFGEAHEHALPFGAHVSILGQKISECKWVGKMCGGNLGEGTLTREIVGCEMWVTIEAKGQRIVRKFERCHQPCGTSGICGPCK